MFQMNLLCALTLCCTIVGMLCDLTANTSSVVQGFGFEMIMTKLQHLEDRYREKETLIDAQLSNLTKAMHTLIGDNELIGDKLDKMMKLQLERREKEEQMNQRLTDLSSKIESAVQQMKSSIKVQCHVYKSCSEVVSSGTYIIQPVGLKERMNLTCDQEFDKGGWIVIQHRFDGSTNFYRKWQDYKKGFGNLEGEFWLGLDRIHQLTASSQYELAVLLEDFDGNKTFAKYEKFEIGNETQSYVITKQGRYSGTAGDSFGWTLGMKFSTFDADNDTWENNCALSLSGAWWYSNCFSSNLNGKYLRGEAKDVGMVWSAFRKNRYSLKTSKILIRPIEN